MSYLILVGSVFVIQLKTPQVNHNLHRGTSRSNTLASHLTLTISDEVQLLSRINPAQLLYVFLPNAPYYPLHLRHPFSTPVLTQRIPLKRV